MQNDPHDFPKFPKIPQDSPGGLTQLRQGRPDGGMVGSRHIGRAGGGGSWTTSRVSAVSIPSAGSTASAMPGTSTYVLTTDRNAGGCCAAGRAAVASASARARRCSVPSSRRRRAARSVLEHLNEGCGVRQTARLTKVNRGTVGRLAQLAGEHASALHDELVAFSPADARGAVRREVGVRRAEAGTLRPGRHAPRRQLGSRRVRPGTSPRRGGGARQADGRQLPQAG